MNKKGADFWTGLIIIGALIILIWVLLKSFGIIQSPVWVETLPYFGVAISIIGGAYKFGKIINKIEETEKKVDGIVRIEDRFNKLESEHNLAMNGKLKIKH